MLSIDELTERLDQLVGKYLKPSDNFKKRKGDDGEFGRRLEEVLGVKENNSKDADIICSDGKVELKTHNIDSNSRNTFFTKEPIWNSEKGYKNIHDVVRAFQTTNKQGVIRCNTTMKNTANNKGLSVKINEDAKKISIIYSNNGIEEVVGYWSFDALESKLYQKCGDKVVLVLRNRKNFVIGYKIYSGGDFESMKEMLKDGRMVIGLRAKTGASKKNRGTVFRISNKYYPDLFSGATL